MGEIFESKLNLNRSKPTTPRSNGSRTGSNTSRSSKKSAFTSKLKEAVNKQMEQKETYKINYKRIIDKKTEEGKIGELEPIREKLVYDKFSEII